MDSHSSVVQELRQRFGDAIITEQPACDEFPMVWVKPASAAAMLRYLKYDIQNPYRMLYDLTAIDERVRANRHGQPAGDFTVVYQLLSLERNTFIRLKVALFEDHLSLPSITDLWPMANWYERNVWDLFGIVFDNHPHLSRIMMPQTWVGHPLRKDHPSRATEMSEYVLPEEKQEREQEALLFHPEEWGMRREREGVDFMFLNLGPNHPSVHGVFRVILQLDGEEIIDAVPDIGYHHRGAEKMAERQTWHTYIPYTDRIDYLGGVINELPYVMAVEKLAGIAVPERVKVIRVMLVELFRIISHLVYYGTFVQDLGALSPVFFMFSDRERAFDIVEAITGSRMHPGWFRVGGVAQDLPNGWDKMMREFIDFMPARLNEYDKLTLQNRILKQRTIGVGAYTLAEAIEWGVTGPNLRSCGLDWDLRRKLPYSGYENFEFDIPVAHHGDCYDRCVVRVEEMRQSLRIIRQCIDNMPAGEYKSRNPRSMPPLKEHTMHDIETLINHFIGVSYGQALPPGEAFCPVEASKGINSYYLISDGGTSSYRTRIRTPSFPHLQTIPLLCRGKLVADLVATLGSLDFVMADVDC